MIDLKSYIREVPDFPTPGVNFKDIGPLLRNSVAFQQAINEMARRMASRTTGASHIVAIESRGFIFGSALALQTGRGLSLARKKGKLPGATISAGYSLEYGSASLEVQRYSIYPCEGVWIVDDVLASGGTAAAASRLVEQLGGIVLGFAFLLELPFLNGRKRLGNQEIFSLISFDK